MSNSNNSKVVTSEALKGADNDIGIRYQSYDDIMKLLDGKLDKETMNKISVPQHIHYFTLKNTNYSEVIANKLFDCIDAVYKESGTVLYLDLSILENIEFKAVLKQLEFSRKFSDGGLLRVAVVEPNGILRTFMRTQIRLQNRKTPIKIFKKDTSAVYYCSFGMEMKKSNKKNNSNIPI